MIRQIQIPIPGDVLTLAQDWCFTLHHEQRNMSLFIWLGLDYVERSRDTIQVMLKTGEQLKVDRIYIRKPYPNFNSVSFVLQRPPRASGPVPKAVPRPSTRPYEFSPCSVDGNAYYASAEYREWERAHKARLHALAGRRPIRFWAKLNDVNQMHVVS